MHFQLLLLATLAGAAIQVMRGQDRSRSAVGHAVLVWVLVGYCGVPMVGVAVAALVWPDRAADMLGFPTGNPFQSFAMVAYLALAVIAVLAFRFRGRYLVGPALAWSVFFAGATWIHLADYAAEGHLHFDVTVHIFLAHGFVSLLLLGGLAVAWGSLEGDAPS